MSSKTKGIFCILSAAFCFSLMNMFVRLSGDIPSVQKSFFRNLIAFFFAAVIVYRKKVVLQVRKDTLIPLLIRATAGTIGILCNFYAVDHLAIADASMLNKLSPFFVVIFSFLILKEKVAFYQVLCIMTAFFGSLFVIKPTADIFAHPASLIGMLGGLTAGLAYAFVRICSKRGVPGPVIVAFFSGFSCAATLPYILLHFTPMTLVQTAMLLLAGAAACGGQFSITSAYTYAPAREISIYDYSQIIFSTILGLLFLGELPDLYSFIGYFIIIGASASMFFLNLAQDRKKTV